MLVWVGEAVAEKRSTPVARTSVIPLILFVLVFRLLRWSGVVVTTFVVTLANEHLKIQEQHLIDCLIACENYRINRTVYLTDVSCFVECFSVRCFQRLNGTWQVDQLQNKRIFDIFSNQPNKTIYLFVEWAKCDDDKFFFFPIGSTYWDANQLWR